MSKFKFTAYNQYERDGIVHCMVWFVPKNTIECNPPYITGKKTALGLILEKVTSPEQKKN
jgi:hypothetical protein